jgi:hypothetical protein
MLPLYRQRINNRCTPTVAVASHTAKVISKLLSVSPPHL